MESADVVIKKHEFMKSSKGESITKYYNFDKDKIVGSGGYGSVVVGTHKDTNEKRAIKIIKKSTVSHSSDFVNEIEIMKSLVNIFSIIFFITFFIRIIQTSSNSMKPSRMLETFIWSWSTFIIILIKSYYGGFA